jgi:hypothetical protein
MENRPAGLRSPMSEPLHICFLSREYPSETGCGGIGSYTYDMTHGLVAADHRVTVIALAVNAEGITDESVDEHRVQPARIGQPEGVAAIGSSVARFRLGSCAPSQVHSKEGSGRYREIRRIPRGRILCVLASEAAFRNRHTASISVGFSRPKDR